MITETISVLEVVCAVVFLYGLYKNWGNLRESAKDRQAARAKKVNQHLSNVYLADEYYEDDVGRVLYTVGFGLLDAYSMTREGAPLSIGAVILTVLIAGNIMWGARKAAYRKRTMIQIGVEEREPEC